MFSITVVQSLYLIQSQVCEKEREKFLTAKYGAHQMALIRKRLKVEMWIFDNLQELYETEVSVFLAEIDNFGSSSVFFSFKQYLQRYILSETPTSST